jgi:integrase/recombinase XerD
MYKITKKPATVAAVIRKGHTNADGAHPVKIRVTFNCQQKYYPVILDGKPVYIRAGNEWDELWEVKVRKDRKRLRDAIEKVKSMAISARDKITAYNRPFSFERFEKEFLQQETGKGFLDLFKNHLETLRAENRVGTYRSYWNAYSAFKDFRNERDLSPFDITVQLLKSFDASLHKRGCGKTTIGIYMRALKVIYNLAADNNPALLESYPFARKQTDRNRYKIKTGAGHKGESLSIAQLQKFIAIKTDPYSPEHEAKLLWLFSFYCQGMNMKDISLLKYRDIQGEVIRYVRSKTKDTEAKESIMEIPLTDPIRQIIREIGNPDKSPNTYIFLIIPNGMVSTVKRRTATEKTQEQRVHEIIGQKTKMINARIQQLCKDSKDDHLKDLQLTSYWARHTYASLLKEAGESAEMIRELLGHSDIRTTESYLKRFDINKRQAVNEKIQSLLKAS